jgi:hypothetical protein
MEKYDSRVIEDIKESIEQYFKINGCLPRAVSLSDYQLNSIKNYLRQGNKIKIDARGVQMEVANVRYHS